MPMDIRGYELKIEQVVKGERRTVLNVMEKAKVCLKMDTIILDCGETFPVFGLSSWYEGISGPGRESTKSLCESTWPLVKGKIGSSAFIDERTMRFTCGMVIARSKGKRNE